MSLQQQFADQDVEVRRVEFDDRTQMVADFGPRGDASVDVVGDTVIVVVGDEQYEVEIDADARAFISNGVLTIEMNE